MPRARDTRDARGRGIRDTVRQTGAVSTPQHHVEIERSYDAPADASPPDLTGVDGIARTVTETTRHLEATYLDTADLALARARITLRRRVGGKDDGWHLKLPGDGADTRHEVQAPLADELPDVIRERVAQLTDAPLEPLVLVVNDRTTTLLLDADDRVLAELCDDHVTTTGLRPGVPAQAWAEWEAELVEGDVDLLDRVEQALLDAGAARLQLASKLVRAMGPLAQGL